VEKKDVGTTDFTDYTENNRRGSEKQYYHHEETKRHEDLLK
jgi:hypothetical protein